MSSRARSARRLASILTHATGVDVHVQYYQQSRVYGVQWAGGPARAEMQQLATAHADDVPELHIPSLVWLHTMDRSPS